ncbi:MAG: hypothetical protein SVZ03_02435 [Spirochaetota bacterium]|nr:hypothetical protein [Spirochaetota bacterium]
MLNVNGCFCNKDDSGGISVISPPVNTEEITITIDQFDVNVITGKTFPFTATVTNVNDPSIT